MCSQIREVLQTVLLALLIFMALQVSVQNFRVEGSSMKPTLQNGQYLLVNKFIYYRLDKARLARWLPFLNAGDGEALYPFHPPDRGEVVVFHFPRDPSRDFVKRVIAVPGDTVEIRQGRVYVNDAVVDEPYVSDRSRSILPRRALGEGEYFVLGDNRPFSNDSPRLGDSPPRQHRWSGVGHLLAVLRVWIPQVACGCPPGLPRPMSRHRLGRPSTGVSPPGVCENSTVACRPGGR